jgi:hypothetical protein
VLGRRQVWGQMVALLGLTRVALGLWDSSC